MPDTVPLKYTEAGRGDPLVLLHGFPLSSAIWQSQQQRLCDQYRVIVPDLRGHGKSPAPEGAYAMETLARDVLALLDSLKIDKAAIMGHSMGGYVTLAAWRIAPERFSALGLIASQAGADTDEVRQNRFRMIDKVAVEGSRAVAEGMVARLFAADLETDDPLIELVRQIILASPVSGIIGSLQGMAARPDSLELLKTVSVPALVLVGEKDQVIPPQKGEDMAVALPNATLALVEDAGHMPMLERADATTAAIRRFLGGG